MGTTAKILAALAIAPLAACSLLYSPDGFDEPLPPDAAPLPEAATDVAPPPADVTIDEAASPMNLVPNGTLETCNEWGDYLGKLSSDPDGHTGAACRVCSENNGAQFSIDGDVPTTPILGATYRARAWVRFAPGSSKETDLPIHLALRTRSSSGKQLELKTSADIAAPKNTWTLFETTLTLTMTAATMDVYVYTEKALPGDCIVIDDVLVTKD